MPGPVFLEGERLNLHLITDEDHAFVARQWINPTVRYQYTMRTKPFQEQDVHEAVERDDIHGFLPCIDGEPIGHVHLNIDWQARRATLSYLIVPDEQGQGYATEAADLCLDHAFDELRLHKVWAEVSGDNEASKRVLQKLGFQQEGVLREWAPGAGGEYVDNYLFGLLRSEREPR